MPDRHAGRPGPRNVLAVQEVTPDNRKGRAYLGREALSKFLGYPDPTRILNYLRILERAGVIHRGTSYSKGRNGKECKLTREAMELLGDEAKPMEG